MQESKRVKTSYDRINPHRLRYSMFRLSLLPFKPVRISPYAPTKRMQRWIETRFDAEVESYEPFESAAMGFDKTQRHYGLCTYKPKTEGTWTFRGGVAEFKAHVLHRLNFDTENTCYEVYVVDAAPIPIAQPIGSYTIVDAISNHFRTATTSPMNYIESLVPKYDADDCCTYLLQVYVGGLNNPIGYVEKSRRRLIEYIRAYPENKDSDNEESEDLKESGESEDSEESGESDMD